MFEEDKKQNDESDSSIFATRGSLTARADYPHKDSQPGLIGFKDQDLIFDSIGLSDLQVPARSRCVQCCPAPARSWAPQPTTRPLGRLVVRLDSTSSRHRHVRTTLAVVGL